MDKKMVGFAAAAVAVIALVIILVMVLGGQLSSDDGMGTGLEVVPASSVTDDDEAVQTETVEKSKKKKTTTAAAAESDEEDETSAQTTTKKSGKKSKSATTAAPETAVPETTAAASDTYVEYRFRSEKLLNQHFEKHGAEFDYATAAEYERGASDVINDPDALYKVEAEDGDGVYYIEATNEFVILSTDGYIRTYFKPSGGIDYFNRQ